MELTGLHLLMSYRCTLACDHCFVWGSPWQTGSLTLPRLREILRQAKALASVEWIYFEGGEPFLFYPTLLAGVREAAEMGFKVGIVTNGYWATDAEAAAEALRPMVGLVQDLSVSHDLYHRDGDSGDPASIACETAEQLGIPLGVISIAQPQTPETPENSDAVAAVGQLPLGESPVRYRGRAAAVLADRASRRPWTEYTECPYENLRDPGRVHVDPLGHLHICQGICIGNLFETPLQAICDRYDPDTHPIVGPLLHGGPAELLRRHDVPREQGYADACHLCDDVRRALRPTYPETLTPDQMYGDVLE